MTWTNADEADFMEGLGDLVRKHFPNHAVGNSVGSMMGGSSLTGKISVSRYTNVIRTCLRRAIGDRLAFYDQERVLEIERQDGEPIWKDGMYEDLRAVVYGPNQKELRKLDALAEEYAQVSGCVMELIRE
jgi:hypothetical protein